MTRPSRRGWLLLGLALVLVAWVAVVGVLLAGAAADLRSGRAAAEDARDDLDAETIASGAPVGDLRRAARDFDSARRAAGNPLVAPVRFVPVVGRQLRSVQVLADAAHEVADAAAVAVARASAALENPSGGGPGRVAQVRELTAALADAHRRLVAIDDLGPREGLLEPLATARNELAEDLGEAREALADAEAGARAGLRFLDGPRRYLLVAANNAEMRAGSGMWLSGGVLSTAAGRLQLGEVDPLRDRYHPSPEQPITIPDPDLADRWGEVWHPERDWRGLMTSPRLPAAAELALRMWEAAGEPPVDGVLVVDPVGLAAVVAATGPVEVAGRSYDADALLPYLFHEQYLRPEIDTVGNVERREELGIIAAAAFEALDAGDWSPSTLASELGDAIAGRHLMAWSSDPVEQAGWEAAGMAGTVRADSLLVSVLNRGGNKLDWFLHVDAELSTEPVPGRSATDVAVRFSFENRAPEGLPRYVAGPPEGMWWSPGDYIGLVALTVPGAATDVRIEGAGPPHAFGPDGPTQVVTDELVLPRGERQERVLRFRLPGTTGSIVVEPSARVPPVRWRHGSSRWQDSERRVANW